MAGILFFFSSQTLFTPWETVRYFAHKRTIGAGITQNKPLLQKCRLQSEVGSGLGIVTFLVFFQLYHCSGLCQLFDVDPSHWSCLTDVGCPACCPGGLLWSAERDPPSKAILTWDLNCLFDSCHLLSPHGPRRERRATTLTHSTQLDDVSDSHINFSGKNISLPEIFMKADVVCSVSAIN